MSLLLDALKKAAEQKAKKSKEEPAAQKASDETLFDTHASDEIPGLADDGSSATQQRFDETEFEQTETWSPRARGEQGRGDETSIDATDITDTADALRLREREPEETAVDVTQTTETRLDRDLPERQAPDETRIDITESTRTWVDQGEPGQPEGDDTGLDITQATQTRVEPGPPDWPQGDDTSVDVTQATQTRVEQGPPDWPEGDETSVDVTQATQTRGEPGPPDWPEGDDTGVDITQPQTRVDLGGPGGSQEDDTAHEISYPEQAPPPDSRPGAGGKDQTDISQPLTGDSRGEDDTASIVDRDSISDEDLSLVLLDEEHSGPGGEDTGITDPHIPRQPRRSPAAADTSDSDLSLADTETAQNRIPQDQTDTQGPTITNPSATRLYSDDTTRDGLLATPTRSTVTRPDTTSTHTYAPDNYDRTLMKLPSDDASRLFAGMKSDTDVVMTPDHAKKIFRSKNSAQRVQNYKYYVGIAFALLLAIALVGGIKYQEGTEEIDASLRPLKRDPMPGQIKPQQSQETGLFAGPDGQVDTRTIEIVQSAGDSAAVDEATVTEQVAAETGTDSAAVVDETSPGSIESTQVEPDPAEVQTEVAMAETATTRASGSISDAAQSITPAGAAAADASGGQPAAANTSARLRIETSSQYREADIWLREAYTAYQAGDLQLAMQRYNQVIEIDPLNRNALLGRAAINVQQGRADAAIEDYQTLLLANPKDSLAMSSLLGVASYSPRETESQLKLMIRDEPDSPYLNFALANAYGAQGRWHDAQQHYFTALQNNPEDPNYAYNLAVSLEHISQPGSARIYYQRALDNINNGLATFSRELVGQRLEVLGKL